MGLGLGLGLANPTPTLTPNPNQRPFAPLLDEEGEGAGGAARPLVPPRRAGWMAKTPSASGPLRHVRNSQVVAALRLRPEPTPSPTPTP